jgi:hypothetical protein
MTFGMRLRGERFRNKVPADLAGMIVRPRPKHFHLFNGMAPGASQTRDRRPFPQGEPKIHMALYVAEFQFRYNPRNDADIFGAAIRGC